MLATRSWVRKYRGVAFTEYEWVTLHIWMSHVTQDPQSEILGGSYKVWIHLQQATDQMLVRVLEGRGDLEVLGPVSVIRAWFPLPKISFLRFRKNLTPCALSLSLARCHSLSLSPSRSLALCHSLNFLLSCPSFSCYYLYGLTTTIQQIWTGVVEGGRRRREYSV